MRLEVIRLNYDLQADASEERNVASEHPEVLAAVQKHLTAAHRPHRGATQPPWARSGAKPKKDK